MTRNAKTKTNLIIYENVNRHLAINCVSEKNYVHHNTIFNYNKQ